MAWTTSTRVDRVLGSSTLRQKLFAVDNVYDADCFAQYEAEARARIVQRLVWAGYSDPGATLEAGTTTEALLAGYCEAVMLMDAFAQAKGIQWPAGLRDRMETKAKEALSLHESKLPIPGLTPSTSAGYGGVQATPTNEAIEGSRPQRMSRAQTKTW
jgi:hypothetical protein